MEHEQRGRKGTPYLDGRGCFPFGRLRLRMVRVRLLKLGQMDGYRCEKFRATVVVPLASPTALCFVIILGHVAGPTEFEGFGFKFKGAAGPLLFWVICFLALSSVLKPCWQAS